MYFLPLRHIYIKYFVIFENCGAIIIVAITDNVKEDFKNAV